MFIVRNSLFVHAPIERVFALSTSIEVVQHELRMSPVEGRTEGFVQHGDVVRWEGKQLGFHNFHVSEIRNFVPPFGFTDRMIEGRFRQFEHDHYFTPRGADTLMRDEIRFSLPFGPAGWAVGAFVMCPHIAKLLNRRFHLIKGLAEGDGWRRYLPQWPRLQPRASERA